ncbi:MAG: C1 family peptidase [Rikenellaceae bacterium]
MKKIILAVSMIALSMSSYAQIELKAAEKTTTKFDAEQYKFTDVKRLQSTPVKDQYSTGTCWCFAGIGTLENDLLVKSGKEYDLSEMWIVRNVYLLKAERYVRMHGEASFSEGAISTDVITAIKKFGLVPESAYSGLNYGTEKHQHRELTRALSNYLDAIIKNPNGKLSTSWKKGYEGILDAYLGARPDKFEFEGVEYTPTSFLAMTGINPDDYVTIGSFTHHPFYGKFPLEIPDNWAWNKIYNVSLEEMVSIINSAIDNGYAIGWDADVSEDGFLHSKGFAKMPVIVKDSVKGKKSVGLPKEIAVTQETRQTMFDNLQTTDDHLMVIVGTAKDQEGNPYYIVKNSWDNTNKYGGFLYASLPYIESKTIGVMVNKNALSSDIKAKLNIK